MPRYLWLADRSSRLGKEHRLLPAAWLLNDGQGILTAKRIGTLTQEPQVFFVIVIMLSVHKGNRIDDKVVMQALGI